MGSGWLDHASRQRPAPQRLRPPARKRPGRFSSSGAHRDDRWTRQAARRRADRVFAPRHRVCTRCISRKGEDRARTPRLPGSAQAGRLPGEVVALGEVLAPGGRRRRTAGWPVPGPRPAPAGGRRPRCSGAARGRPRRARPDPPAPVRLTDRDRPVERERRASRSARAARRTSRRSAPSRSPRRSWRRRAAPRSRPGPGTGRAGRGPGRPGGGRRPRRSGRCASGSGPAPPAGSVARRASVRASRRAWCSSIRASRPATSGSSLASPATQLPGQPDRLGDQVDIAGVALVEHQVERGQHGARSPGWSKRTSATVRLARLIRWAIVASGTR